MWFNFLSKILPNRDVATTLKKILMGQAVFGPVINTVFFSYNGALQGNFHILNGVFSSLFNLRFYIVIH
jgi:hypothetical protein